MANNKKKRRSARTESTFGDEENNTETTVAEETEDDTADEEADDETTDEAETDEDGDEEESEDETEDDSGGDDDELEHIEVNVKLTSPKQFVAKLTANIQAASTIFFTIGGTTVAAAECTLGEDVLIRILPTSHAQDLSQFLYDGLEGEGQDPSTVSGLDKNGYNYSLKIDW
ncbi:MAG: hypothetical protein EBU84_02990 [Actinobacteria bacterium]|nr:hypothetical protein [Actinomycetota bacterium]